MSVGIKFRKIIANPALIRIQKIKIKIQQPQLIFLSIQNSSFNLISASIIIIGPNYAVPSTLFKGRVAPLPAALLARPSPYSLSLSSSSPTTSRSIVGHSSFACSFQRTGTTTRVQLHLGVDQQRTQFIEQIDEIAQKEAIVLGGDSFPFGQTTLYVNCDTEETASNIARKVAAVTKIERVR